MNKEQIERYAYFISFSHHLSDFDFDAHRDVVLAEIEDEESGVVNVWEPFERMSRRELLDSIYNLANHIIEMFSND